MCLLRVKSKINKNCIHSNIKSHASSTDNKATCACISLRLWQRVKLTRGMDEG